MVDAATLTGAVIAALGHHAAALLGTDEPLWAHLDIAGTAWDVKDVSYHPSRATGYGARLFAELAAGWNGG